MNTISILFIFIGVSIISLFIISKTHGLHDNDPLLEDFYDEHLNTYE